MGTLDKTAVRLGRAGILPLYGVLLPRDDAAKTVDRKREIDISARLSTA